MPLFNISLAFWWNFNAEDSVCKSYLAIILFILSSEGNLSTFPNRPKLLADKILLSLISFGRASIPIPFFSPGLGISNKIVFYKVQIPIAIRQSLPAYGNEIILMMKGTSLASTVTLMDLTGVAKYIISTTFKPIEVFIVAGGIYLFMTFVIHNVIKSLEKKYSFNS